MQIHKLTKNKPLTITLHDFSILINLVGKEPMPLAQLIPNNPDILGKSTLLSMEEEVYGGAQRTTFPLLDSNTNS